MKKYVLILYGEKNMLKKSFMAVFMVISFAAVPAVFAGSEQLITQNENTENQETSVETKAEVATTQSTASTYSNLGGNPQVTGELNVPHVILFGSGLGFMAARAALVGHKAYETWEITLIGFYCMLCYASLI
jgi:hypothetical protein